MNATEMTRMIGRTGSVFFGRTEMTVHVQIMDVKTAYGQTRYLIEPLAGRGATWIQSDSITLDEN